MRKKILLSLGLILIVGGVYYTFLAKESFQTQKQTGPSDSKKAQPENSQPAGFDKRLYPLDQAGSPWWVVNKKRPLPDGYVPPDLGVPNVKLRLAPSQEQMQYSKQATPALEEMFAAAQRDGVILVFGSGYRSEAYQRTLYNGYVASSGQAYADKTSARPGTSEHQTGLAFDATAPNGKCHLEECFGDLPEGRWLQENAHKYGFMVRYPKGKTDITGYDYEPWHMRYVGKELSNEMHGQGIQTLEEFFGLPAAPTY